jgi:hypothetical protein
MAEATCRMALFDGGVAGPDRACCQRDHCGLAAAAAELDGAELRLR